MSEKDQFFKFRRQNRAILFVDGNYMINISRLLSLKIDIERLFDEISKEFFRHKTYWYSAIEGNLERSNSTFRFLDRLRYIPRTKVFAGRLARRQGGQYDSALKTDAGIAMASDIVEQAIRQTAEYLLVFAAHPEYVPAIKTAQRHGMIVRIIAPQLNSELKPHAELIKAADEVHEIDDEFFESFEYMDQAEYLDEDIDDNNENLSGEYDHSDLISEEGEINYDADNDDNSENDEKSLQAQIGKSD